MSTDREFKYRLCDVCALQIRATVTSKERERSRCELCNEVSRLQLFEIAELS